MAPPITKKVPSGPRPPTSKPVILSEEVRKAAQNGEAISRATAMARPRDIVAASQVGAEDYGGIVPPGIQVAQGVAGSMVPDRSNVIKAVWAENKAFQDSDLTQPQRIMPTGMIGQVGRRYDNRPGKVAEFVNFLSRPNAEGGVATAEFVNFLNRPNAEGRVATDIPYSQAAVAPNYINYSDIEFGGPVDPSAARTTRMDARDSPVPQGPPLVFRAPGYGVAMMPQSPNNTGPSSLLKDKPRSAFQGIELNPNSFYDSNTPVQNAERLQAFYPEYESTRVPGAAFDERRANGQMTYGRMVNRVDTTPETQQFYIGKTPSGIDQVAQKAFFNTQINKNSYTKAPERMTPDQIGVISQSFAADGIDPRAYAVRPGGIQTYQSPDPRGLTFSEYPDTNAPDPRGITPSVQDARAASGSRGTALGPIPAYKGQKFMGVGTDTFRPGAPALPGRDDRWFQRPNRDARGQRVVDDRWQALIGNAPEDKQAAMLREYPNGVIANFAHDSGGPDGGMSGSEIVGNASGYAFPQAVVNRDGNGQVIPNSYESAINAGAAVNDNGVAVGGQTVGSLMFDVNEDFNNGVNIGPGLKRDFQAGEFSPDEIVNLVTEAQSVGDFIDSGYTSGTGDNKIAKMLREDRNRGGISRENPKGLSTLQDTLDAEAFAESASPRIKFQTYRTVDPKTGEAVSGPSESLNRDLESVGGWVSKETGNAYTVDPNSPDAMYGSRATRQVADANYRNQVMNERPLESAIEPMRTRNPESYNWGLKPDENEDLVPYSDGSLGRSRTVSGANVMKAAQDVEAIKQDPAVQSEVGSWLRDNYPEIVQNMEGATSFSSMGLNQSTNQLPSGANSYDDLVADKNLPEGIQSLLERGDSGKADAMGGDFRGQPDSIDLPGFEGTGTNRVFINSTAPFKEDGQTGFVSNMAGADPQLINRQQTMFNPVTKQKEVFNMTDSTGAGPFEYANQAESRAKQQKMALKQSLNEFYRDGGVIKDELGRPLAAHFDAVGFDGETVHDSNVAKDLSLGLPPREDAYGFVQQIYDQASPRNRGSGIDQALMQVPDRIMLQANATKAAYVRAGEIRSKVDSLMSDTAVDNIGGRESAAFSFPGPDGQVRTSVHSMGVEDQLKIQRYLKGEGMGELQNQYTGVVNSDGDADYSQVRQRQDPSEVARQWSPALNRGEMTREQYDDRVAGAVQQYVQEQIADPSTRSFRAAIEAPPKQQGDESLPSREQMEYSAGGRMPESLTARPNAMLREGRDAFMTDGVVRDPTVYTPDVNLMRQSPSQTLMRESSSQQTPQSRDRVNPVVQVNEERRLNRGQRGAPVRRSQANQEADSLAVMADAAMGMSPQQRAQSIIDAAELEAGAAQRRRDLEAVGRYQQ